MAWNEKRTLTWVLTSQASATLVITRKSPTFAGWLWLLVVSMAVCAIGHGGGGSGGATTVDARGAGPEEAAGEVERVATEVAGEARAELEEAACGGGVRGATEDVEASGGGRDGGNGGNTVGMASPGAAFGPAAQAPSTEKHKATRARVGIRGV